MKTYDELRAERAALEAAREAHYATREAVQAAMDAAVMAAARLATGKALRSLQKAREALDARGTLNAVVAPLRDPWVAEDERLHAALEALTKPRREAARAATFSDADTRTTWRLFACVSASSYRSQGYGCDKYTRAAAQEYVAHAARYGVKAEVRDVALERRTETTGLRHCEVWVLADSRDVELLRDKPDDVSLREWVRMCWKRGVNPRVYNPHLPHGYEEQHGLDFFGGERCAAPAE